MNVILNMKKAILFTLIINVFSPVFSQKKNYTISGYIREAISLEYLSGANIYLPGLKTGTTANKYGFYSITLPSADSVELIISFVGYAAVNIKVPLIQNIDLNVELRPGTILKEITITSDRRERPSESVRMSAVKLPVEQIKKVPTLLGEKDVLKVLQLLPGVQKGSEGSSGLYVRGGGPDQNLIILDDATVYNASHLFGFLSVFNGDALKSVELIKGGFPARYGGRLSSVLEMQMKDGNKEKWHGSAGIGLVSANATLEGPIKKEKISILLSGRRTFADVLAAPFTKGEIPNYYFYDFNAKINFDFSRNNKLYLSSYFGKDKYNLNSKSDEYIDKFGFNWGNSTATARWNHLFSDKFFSNASLIYSNYDFNINNRSHSIKEDKDYYAEYNSGIRDFSLKYDIDFIPNPGHWFKTGVIFTDHRFNPYAFVEDDNMNEVHTRKKIYSYGIESGIYLEDTWQPFQSLKINPGLRLSHFIADKKQYLFPEPRISAAWRLNSTAAVKGSYAVMNQYIHLLTNTGIGLPTDLWVPVTDNVKPQRSSQVAFGFVKELDERNLSFSVEAYYKKMKNVIAYKQGASFVVLYDPSSAATQMDWQKKVTVGRSWSYGAEFLVRKTSGRLTGWAGYTLSWTPMQFDSLNFGKKFYARYDRRHDISLVGFYKFSDHITFSGTWVYGTGNALTLANSTYMTSANSPDLGNSANPFCYNNLGGGYMGFEYSQKNNFRMSPYHRLDLGVQFKKEKKWGERIWEISIYNVYNRHNPFFYYSGLDFSRNLPFGVGILKQVSLFPVIPSFSYSLKF
jgi:hypothetical protein